MNNDKLTSIRGVACLIVAIWHSIFMFNVSPGLDDYLVPFASRDLWTTLHQIMMMIFSGEGAVVVFFVLSGCVLSIQLNGLSSSSLTPVLTYYRRRIFRIYPMVICSVLIAAALFALLQHLPGVRAMPLSTTEYLDQAFSKLDLIKNMIGMDTAINPPLWSLKVEIELSVGFPLIYLASKRPILFVMLAIVTVIIIFIDAIGHAPLRRSIFAFVVGAAMPRYTWIGRSLGKAEFPIVIISVATLMIVRRLLEPLDMNVGTYVLPETFAAAMIVRAVFFRTVRLPVLEWRSLKFLGEISYSYYVLHYPVLWSMILLFWRLFGVEFPAVHPMIADIILAVLTASATFPLSWLTYRIIEMPFHEWGRRQVRGKFA
jgi:peptidoglycan/LPS O-acetylase OafA/YrhL